MRPDLEVASRRRPLRSAVFRHLRPNWQHFTLGVATSAVTLWFAMPAWADGSSPPASCQNGQDWHVVGHDEDKYKNTMSGVKGNVWFDDGHHCNRVSAIIVVGPDHTKSDFQFYEFGWITGNTFAYCGGQYYHKPTLFISYSRKGEKTQCDVYPNKQPDSGSYHVMRASDENENTWWGAYIGGNEIVASVTNMDFHQGLGIASSERGNANDSAFAAFADLREHHTSNGWTPWENVRLLPDGGDTDPDYHFERLGNDFFWVVHD